MTGRVKCPHTSHLADFTQSDIEKAKDVAKCADCYSPGPNLWLCLHRGCLKVGCGEAHNDHSTTHNRHFPNHCLHLNLSTTRVWCYQCEKEVFLELMDPPRRASVQSQQTVRYSPPPPPAATGDSGDSSDSEGSVDDCGKPRGLTGLQNIGNTCYMNSALQALSNTPPLTQYFLDCGASLLAKQGEKKPGLSRSYHRLVQEMWHRKRPGYVVPSGVLYGIRNVHPMFRGYQQHDTQEFLRCFMDQLHEELKEPIIETAHNRQHELFRNRESFEDSEEEEEEGTNGGGVSSQSEGEYETCDSGVSERSSLSDEGDRTRGTGKRKLSRSPSPPTERVRSKLTSQNSVGSRGGSSPARPSRRRHTVKHRSIISDVFDGKLLSSVQCLTCDRISTRVETFQDLSLPIPSRDHIHMIHQGSLTPQKGGLSACSDVYSGDQISQLAGLYMCPTTILPYIPLRLSQGWVTWLWEWFRSWFWGPTVSLHDCLAAFFSADELKGDNMYSCEKCNKLRNGVKYSKVLELPEVLCIHLKRFRHELMFSAKINSYVSFPLEGLDMRPYMHKDCVSCVTSYDLVSVICHHGTAGGGHYTCYSYNCISERWFEFDDQYVTQVTAETVQSCEAYVLFYKKSSEAVSKMRSRAVELIELSHTEPSLMQFYVSKQWVNRFNTFAEPGPIDNSDFLCIHGGVHPAKAGLVDQLCTILSQPVWEYLYDNFGGGPACNCLYECATCSQEQEALQRRIKQELEVFVRLNKEFQAEDSQTVIYAIAMSWFRQWQHFVQGKEDGGEPPGAIDNSSIIANKGGQPALKTGSDYAQLSEELWHFFRGIYSGGPELALRAPTPRGGGPIVSSFATTNNPTPRSTPESSLRPEPLLTHGLKSRSTENINSCSVSVGQGAALVRPARAQSVSSDNITVRMAALCASGNKRIHDAKSDQYLGNPRMMAGSTGKDGDKNRFVTSSTVNIFKDEDRGSSLGMDNPQDLLDTEIVNQNNMSPSLINTI